ncbi:Transposon Ty3-I Gag-Pol polyprotein AltName: Full=Gag3-Pol3; AltName: Full=Transposon Ty3-2 TYA-TYB polyprotein; Contains: RecName: Full=Capsid protein; Short=CA; AltName: Full=p24; Contains: RecName: Full=Spacer peptide p3; Contains: RecName: Full=Nucleocapsid protein p11; Short=NC; Contains: RecName: Full=Ty3 protease; Short=PR; AltName: Full=p16; Contains: RecName: Full=Spacer peptide J; Contains: RecName: Full=Reverse transcriptase/ribonuclease H; Short=RT; Short=RT-RH; AltName: Full=p55; Contains: Re|nr:Transposon Ty3-I Gag-Pol polyprotein AltName: Full=Gag3-Pol3; AltName: Full=Transposon Ty3-2 TYA-TYB polyprotein; Contains: RecName: Full=Capsid protein; Short=CA; AltName: Full=p24; Contains: RecName: Full=Spacer peptide p3; Contains: RecName: Full=Nucleocapsid protein p11; Short=NC; Contains: RecName: Full=Ty3 protease; Short=PR; AltName: Full=p16; Contains: RecName: Full=Spacer peptide J; Contains: RecName: Full=Reverse transcriptase/ribonuclease H; Short=RT; Short=RT-RH; AltName: Full=p55; C
MASQKGRTQPRPVEEYPERLRARAIVGSPEIANTSAQNVASILDEATGEPDQTVSPFALESEVGRTAEPHSETRPSEFRIVRPRRMRNSDSETSGIARTRTGSPEGSRTSPITGPKHFPLSFEGGDNTTVRYDYGIISDEEGVVPKDKDSIDDEWDKERALIALWEVAQGKTKEEFLASLEMPLSQLNPSVPAPGPRIADRESLQGPSEADPEPERFSTAAKGKFRATELPPMTSRDGTVRFAPEAGSLEADMLALIEHDRQVAQRIQDELDEQHAQASERPPGRPERHRSGRHMTIESISEGEEGSEFIMRPQMNVMSTPIRRPANERANELRAKAGNERTVSEIIREGSQVPRVVPLTNIPLSIPPSEQINPSTYLFAQMATPSRPKATSTVSKPSRIIYPSGFGANTGKVDTSKTVTTTIPPMTASAPNPSTNAGIASTTADSSAKTPANALANAPDPSDSSSSSSDEPSSSDSEVSAAGRSKGKRKKSKNSRRRREKAEEAHRAKIASALKLLPPEKWNGNANIDIFESWLFDVNLWYKNHAVPEDMRVSTLSNFLEGKARRTFMSIVSPEIEQWTQDQVIRLFFDELFPSNIIEQLRDRFAKSYQGTLSVRAWSQRIRDLAKPVGDISEKEKIRQFWDGARPTIRIEWCREGYSREQSTFEQLKEAAERIERKEQQMKIERDKTESRMIRTASILKKDSARNVKPRPNDTRDRRGKTYGGQKSKHTSTGGRKGDFNTSKQTHRRLTAEEMEEHRAKGQCFNCHETGHRAHDCPKRNQLRPPKLISGSITFDQIDAQAKDVTNLMCGSMLFVPVTEPDRNTVKCRNLGVQIWAEGELETGLHDIPIVHDAIGYEGKRFIVEPMEDCPGIFIVDDLLLGLEWSFTAMDLHDEDFDICRSYYEYADSQRTEWAHLLEPDAKIQACDYDFDILEREIINKVPSEDDDLPALIPVPVDSDVEMHDDEPDSSDSESDELFETKSSIDSQYAKLRDAMTTYRPFIDDSNSDSERISPCSDSELADDDALPFRERFTRLLARFSRDDGAIPPNGEESDPEESENQAHLRVHMTGEVKSRRGRPARQGNGTLIERNAAKTRDIERCTPKPCVLDGFINGNPVRMLVDSGSMADFISTTLVDQLKIPYDNLEVPLSVQLAVRGSRGKINATATVKLQYEEISESRRFDVMNIDSYDIILGTPFLFQHQALVGFNPTRFAFESVKSKPIQGDDTARISSQAARILDKNLERVREMMRLEAADLCKSADETPLPPYRVVNHRIPLKDESIQLLYIPSRCPQAFQEQWERKRDTYLRTGRWKYATGSSAVPMLFIPKKPGLNGEKRLRTVFAKQRLNQNTIKLSSPLPDIQTILETVAPYQHKSLIDGRDAYEQIRVDPDDVWKTLFNTPDGTMVSEVMQQGDCNAGATYQTLMNSLFAPYAGKFMFVYLDDIIIFSNTVEEHIEHIRTVLNVLRKEKLYLTSVEKLQFFARPLKVLGHVIDERGILMDPHKVDRIENWKTPTTPEQVAAFTGMKRWLEELSHFDFEISYVPGGENCIADGLSRIYSDEPKGIIRTDSEYVTRPMSKEETKEIEQIIRGRMARSKPLYTGKPVQAQMAAFAVTRAQKARNQGQTVGATVEGDAPRAELTTPKPATPKRPIFTRELSPESEENSASDEEPPKRTVNSNPSVIGVNLPNQTPNPTSENEAREARDQFSEIDRRQSPCSEEPAIPKTTQPTAVNQTHDVDDLPEISPSLTYLVNQAEEGISLPGGLRGRYSDDSFFAPIAENPVGYNHFMLDDGLLYHKTDGKRVLCIPDVEIEGRKVREILITHAHSILAHLGAEKTLSYLRENVWWKGMSKDISEYCSSCTTCAHSKAVPTQPFGLLKTLEVPKRAWESIGIDFVGPLPSSSNRDSSYDMICTIIDHLTSMVHLVPMRQTYTAKDVAELVFEEVYKIHGLPERIISDRDSYFTSTFWTELHRLIGVELRLSTSFHPQTDGATERANRTMTTMLRQAVSDHQRDWATKLPAIEFAMNLARSVSTGYSPFFLNYGQMPRSMLTTDETVYPGVRKRALEIREAILSAHDAILSARVKQTSEANKHRRPAPFAEGDLVYLSTKNLSIPKGRARKLIPKYIGPYKIVKVIVPGASFRLELPAELKQRGIHPVFHASLLRIHIPNDDRKFPGRTLEHVTGFGKPSEWPVDKIVSHEGKGKRAIFEVLWKSGDKSWELYATIKALAAMERYLEAQGVETIEGLAEGQGKTPNDAQIRVAVVAIKPEPTSAISQTVPICSHSSRRATMSSVDSPTELVTTTQPIIDDTPVDDETLVIIPRVSASVTAKLKPVLAGELEIVKKRIHDLERAVEKLKAKSNVSHAPNAPEPSVKEEPVSQLLPSLGKAPPTRTPSSRPSRRRCRKQEEVSNDGDVVMNGPESELDVPVTQYHGPAHSGTPYTQWVAPYKHHHHPRGRKFVHHAFPHMDTYPPPP